MLPLGRPPKFEMLVSIGLLLLAWQTASLFLPEFMVPGLQLIAAEFIKMARKGTLPYDALLTLYRVMQGLVGGFVLGGLLGIVMGSAKKKRGVHHAGGELHRGRAGAFLDVDRHSLV